MIGPSSFELLLRFSLYSLMAVGGANALIPEIHREFVDNYGWFSNAEFNTLYAIAQAAPGPNVLIVSLIGWKLTGLGGTLACTVGMCGPSSLIALYIGRLWERFKHSPWRRALQLGLAPITIGLVIGSAALLIKTTGTHWQLLSVALGTAVLATRFALNPLIWLAMAAVLGALGLLN